MLQSNSVFQLRDLRCQYSSTCSFSFKDPVFEGMPNNEKFDRHNCYEMILFINSLQIIWNVPDIESGQKIEYLIREKMPKDVERQLEVADWLVLYWNEFDLPKFAKAV